MPNALPANVSGLGGLFVYANSVANDQLGTLLVVAFFAVTFFSLKNYTLERALIASGFSAFIISVFFAMMGVADTLLPVAFLVITIVGMFLSWREG